MAGLSNSTKEREQREQAASIMFETTDGADLGTKDKVVAGTDFPVADVKSVTELKQRVPKEGVTSFILGCSNATAGERLRVRKQSAACKPMQNRGPVELKALAISHELNASAPSDLRFTFRFGTYMVLRSPMWDAIQCETASSPARHVNLSLNQHQ